MGYAEWRRSSIRSWSARSFARLRRTSFRRVDARSCRCRAVHDAPARQRSRLPRNGFRADDRSMSATTTVRGRCGVPPRTSSNPPVRRTRAISAIESCHSGTWWMIPKSTTASTDPDAWSMEQTSPTDNDTGRPCSRRSANATMDSSRSKAVTRSAPSRSRITSEPTPRPHPTSSTCWPDNAPPASRRNHAASRWCWCAARTGLFISARSTELSFM